MKKVHVVRFIVGAALCLIAASAFAQTQRARLNVDNTLLSIEGPAKGEVRFYEGGSKLAVVSSDNVLTLEASQELPVTLSVTLTAEQVEALKAEFGTTADLKAKTQAWVNEWLVQFVSKLEEKQKREMFEALKSAKPEDVAEVKKRLKIKQ